MDTADLGKTRFMNALLALAGKSMESGLRARLFDPRETLRGADIAPGQAVLEVGCGTGFFSLPAAEMIGESGRLIAMDALSGYVERVRTKVREAGLSNVEVVRRDALNTGLADACVDVVLLFGVVPFPTLPLDRLLPEVHRVLKAEGLLAVWLFPTTFGVPSAILRSGLFSDLGKRNGVYRFGRSERRSGGPM